jgi:hypothetical protein
LPLLNAIAGASVKGFGLQNLLPILSYLVVAGGGGGGRGRAGGGGAGGMRTGSLFVNSSYIITIGSGGAGSNNSTLQGSNGSSSSISSLSSLSSLSSKSSRSSSSSSISSLSSLSSRSSRSSSSSSSSSTIAWNFPVTYTLTNGTYLSGQLTNVYVKDNVTICWNEVTGTNAFILDFDFEFHSFHFLFFTTKTLRRHKVHYLIFVLFVNSWCLGG